MSAIRVEDVHKTYPNGFAAVRGVDLTAHDGEFQCSSAHQAAGKRRSSG
jgi:Predicted ATPase involved in cell division